MSKLGKSNEREGRHRRWLGPSGEAIASALLEWFGRNARDLPWRRTRDPYAIWVSEIMLQQTQVKTVLPCWERWMQALPGIEALANARPERLHKLWEGLGYYTRVRNLQQAARLILARHDGQFPRRFEEVLALPGIGRYTAGAICSIAFHQPTPVLDGNVIRVLTRLFGISGNPREKQVNARLWQLAETLVLQAAKQESGAGSIQRESGNTQHATRNTQHALAATLRQPGASPFPFHVSRATPPSRACSHFNQSLMELGALICTPRQPQCGLCPVAELCAARRQGRVHELPQLGRRPRTTPRRFAAFIVRQGSRFLVCRRPGGVVNGHLWEFPNIELAPADGVLKRAARQVLGFSPAALEPFCTIKHSITRYRITLEAYCVNGKRPGQPSPANGRWLSPGELRRLAFAGAHKKLLQRLGV